MTAPEILHLHTMDDLDRALAESASGPVLIFKHSYSCGTSAEALDELLAHAEVQPATARIAIVTVQTDRAISNAITARLGIRHETPQALLVRDGKVVWSASHFRVTSAEISRAIARAAAQADDHAH